MSGKSPAAFAILANSGSAIRIWWSGEERERAERISAEDFSGLPLVELYTGDAMRDVEQQRDVLLTALEFAREKVAYLHIEAGDGDCHYQIIDDAIASVKGGAA